MSWQFGLCLAALAAVVICLGGSALLQWHQKRFLRIPYSVINAYKITPRFIVGGDCK